MKNLFLIWLMISPFIISAQISVERSVFSSLGTSSSGALNIEATYGESSIGLFDNGNHIVTIGFHQTVDIIDQTSKTEDFSIDVFPNPTRHNITVRSTTKIDKIEIISMSGAILFTQKNLQKNDSNIDLSQLSKGMFILSITTSNGVVQQEQIIVQ